MKALALQGPGRVDVVDAPEPGGDGGVLLQVRIIGLCGSDLNSFRGNNPMVSYPRILGHEVAATVAEGTSNLPQGTRVTVSPYTSCGRCRSCMAGRFNCCQFNQTLGVQRDGAACEWIRVPEEKIYPSHTLGFRELALVEPLTVGFHAVARGRVAAGEVVAIYGCGGVGLGAVAGASFRGAEVIAIDQDRQKLQIAASAGATHLLDASQEDISQRLLELTGGHGPHVIIEAIGLPATFLAAVEQVAFAGRVVYIGYAQRPVSYQTKLFVQKELDILGSRNALPEDFREVMAMLEAGRFPVDEAITEITDLEHAGGRIAQWADHPSLVSKLMVQIGS